MGIEYILTADGELYHHGTKGMKWGIRRWQNKDGSLTPAGKKRYAKEEAALKEREKAIKNRERESAKRAKLDAKKADLDAREAALNGGGKKPVAKDAGKPKTKPISEMTDAELNDAINRARMEDTYRNLRPEPVAKPKFSQQLVKDVVTPALMNSGKRALESVLDKAVKDMLKDKADPNSLEALKKTYEKLDYQRKIEKLKRGEDPNEKPLTWEDKLKKQQWEKNERERAKNEADEAAKKAKADADAAAKKAQSDADEAAKKFQDAYYANKAEAREQARQKQADRKAKEFQDSYYDYKNQAAAKRYQDDYYRRKDEAKAKREAEPKVTVEGEGSSHKRRNTESTKRRSHDIVDEDLRIPSSTNRHDEYANKSEGSSNNLPTIYNASTSLSNISSQHTSAGRDYVNSVSWDDLYYSGKSGKSSSKKSNKNTDYDVEDLLRRNGEKLEDWYERMKRDGFI